MDLISRKLDVVFFSTTNGREPVKEWLKKMSTFDRVTMSEDIKTVQFGWPLGMPLVRKLADGLWEIRVKLQGGNIARVIFMMDRQCMILLHGFIKKSNKTPKNDLDLSKRRKRQYNLSK